VDAHPVPGNTHRTRVRPIVWGALGLMIAQLLVSAGNASARVASVTVGHGSTLDVTVRGPATVGRSDFKLSAAGDIFGVKAWDAGRSPVTIPRGQARRLRVAFGAPRAALEHAALSFHGELVALSPRRHARRAFARAAQQSTINTFAIRNGVGDPWGTAADGSGRIWFAEPGCDFGPTCAAGTPPGQIGVLDPASGAATLYTLPNIPGNQPIFVAFDGAGILWFTTPDNDRIGAFSPATGSFIGQWQVSSGSGPWDLTFVNGQIWYTEHHVAALGRFDPATHGHQDFPTPSGNSNPYGIAASGGRIWFTENNSNVDQVGMLDTTRGNAISEYPIVHPFSGTPHMIVVDPNGQPWWTEGWSNTLATLNPAVATAGNCGPATGTCNGVQRWQLPPPSASCGGGQTHASGLALDGAGRIWLDNSVTAQVGSFTPSTQTFDLTTLSGCAGHPHDGVSLDPAGNVWFDLEFANALGELVVPPAPSRPPAPAPATESSGGPPPANKGAPKIRGSRREAHTLTAQNGSWSNSPTAFSYAWQRCARRCVTIGRATSRSYRLAAADIDSKVRVVVTAGNGGGSAQAASRAVGPIGPSLKRANQALARLLSASTKGWTIATLRRAGGSTGAFRAPSGGRLRISWYARHVRLATGGRRFAKAHGARFAIHVTRQGARLLRRSSRLTIGAKAVFTPTGEAGIVSRTRVTLSLR
jgi:streptogramin lyase